MYRMGRLDAFLFLLLACLVWNPDLFSLLWMEVLMFSFFVLKFRNFLCFVPLSSVGLNHEQGLELDSELLSGVEFRGGLSLS